MTLEDLEETSRLLQRGRYKAARRALAPLLSTYPSSPRVLAAEANLDALTKVTTFQESAAVVRGLIAKDPDNFRLHVAAAYMEGLGGERESAIEELRDLAIEYPDEAYAHQCLAGMLHLDKEHWVESWQQYELALASGPLTSPCFKTAAFHIARKVDPSNANLALKGSSMIERAGIQTRSKGPRLMFGIFAVLYAMGIFLLGGVNHTAGFVVAALAIASTAWDAYVNDFACCKKCRNFWIGLGVFALISFAVAYASTRTSGGAKAWFVFGIEFVAIILLIRLRWTRAAQKESAPPN